MPRERECVGLVQNCLVGKVKHTHTELGGREHACARMTLQVSHSSRHATNQMRKPIG